MTDRAFRVILGLAILAALYFGQAWLMYSIIGILLFQGVTNWRIPLLASRLRCGPSFKVNRIFSPSPGIENQKGSRFEAERALSFVVVILLIISYEYFPEQLWFLSWFTGFALLGAGLTGICPMVLGLRRIGCS